MVQANDAGFFQEQWTVMKFKAQSIFSRFITVLTLPFTFVCNHFESGLGHYTNSFVSLFPKAPSALVQKLDALFLDKAIAIAFYTGDKDVLVAKGFKCFETAWDSIVVEHPLLEGWILKAGSRSKWFTSRGALFSRVEQTERARRFIEKHSLTSLEVPDTYLYPLKGFNSACEASYVVVAQKVDRANLSLADLPAKARKELYFLVESFGIWDAFGDNVLITERQSISFVDIESLIELDTWWWALLEKHVLCFLKGKIGVYLLEHKLVT
jgi:hypothetical protein